MRLKHIHSFFLPILLTLSFTIMADGVPEEVSDAAKKLGLMEENVSTTPVEGLYELQAGTQLYYLSRDGKYLISGDIVDLENRKNLTQGRLKDIRVKVVAGLKDDQMISFPAKESRHTITIFTDIDCGYCRKLHAEMADYNDLGISVNYLFYPRTGIDSAAYKKAVSVWCNENQQDAMTRAKAGKVLPELSCTNPVARHFMLGNELGINGTPAIVTEQGDLMPGYMPPQEMKSQLDRYKVLVGDKI